MKRILNSHHPKRHARSFKYAFDGVLHTLINEPNFRVQLVIVAAVSYFGYRFRIDRIEWALLIISNGLLLSAEMINTVVENFINVLINDRHEGAKIIKDVSAGFVLISAIVLLLVLLIIFGEHFIKFFV